MKRPTKETVLWIAASFLAGCLMIAVTAIKIASKCKRYYTTPEEQLADARQKLIDEVLGDVTEGPTRFVVGTPRDVDRPHVYVVLGYHEDLLTTKSLFPLVFAGDEPNNEVKKGILLLQRLSAGPLSPGLEELLPRYRTPGVGWKIKAYIVSIEPTYHATYCFCLIDINGIRAAVNGMETTDESLKKTLSDLLIGRPESPTSFTPFSLKDYAIAQLSVYATLRFSDSEPERIAVAEETLLQAALASVDYMGHVEAALDGTASDIADLCRLQRVADAEGSLGHGLALFRVARKVGDERFAAGIGLLTPEEASVFSAFKEGHVYSRDNKSLEELLPQTIRVFKEKAPQTGSIDLKTLADKAFDGIWPDMGESLHEAGRPALWNATHMSLGDTGFQAAAGPCRYEDKLSKDWDYYSINVVKVEPDGKTFPVYFQRDFRIDEIPGNLLGKEAEDIVTFDERSRIVTFTLGNKLETYTLPTR